MKRIFGEDPKVKIISFLLDHPEDPLNKTSIVKGAGVGRNTFYNKLPDLKEEGVIMSIGSGRGALCKLNVENPVVKALLKLRREGHL
jgi:DNA-binding transcriptional ArsR family regulator